ncbi:facilitated trehalose transporter Tret1-like [Pieris napi]|uniref:facilitated trehalose transporter Tret1-like n=1 Tax=Pieris napi TaxID=78633 RepID=UPI001FB9B1A1|nr:facilitated trehalose transporter Tret1-like [Pieris napi]
MQSQRENSGHTYMQWIVASIVNIATLAYGMEVGWISPMTKILQSESSPMGYPLSDNVISWVASVLCIAGSLGVIFFSYLADKIGRKWAIIALLVPQTMSLTLRLLSPTVRALVIARILAGITGGGCFTVIPMYVKEISQESLTGVLVSQQVLFQNIGILIMYTIGIYLDYYSTLWIISVLPVITLLLLLKAPESPAFLVKQQKIHEAYKVVALLRGLESNDKRVENEVESMQRQDDEFKAMPHLNLLTILKDDAWRKGVIITLIFFTIQSFNGAVAIVTFGVTILQSTGVEFNIDPEFQALSFPVIMIIASLLLTVVVEKFGRKILLIGAFTISAVALLSLAIALLLRLYGGSLPNWLPIVSLMTSVAMFYGSITPLTYIVTTEMFVFQIRAKLMGLVCSYCWITFFIPLTIYTPITNMFGAYTSFFIFGIFNVIGLVFTILYIPETKGKSDEEIRTVIVGRRRIDDSI